MGLGTGTQTVIYMASSTVTKKTRGLMKSIIQEGDNHFVLQHPNWSCALYHSKRQNCDCTLLLVISSITHTHNKKQRLSG